MIFDLLKVSFSNLKKRKLRSYLTLIGIFIGIMSVTALISLGNSFERAINEQIGDLGADKLIFTPAGFGFADMVGGNSPFKFTESEIDIIKRHSNVNNVLAYDIAMKRVEFKRYEFFAFLGIYSVSPSANNLLLDLRYNPKRGRLLTESDQNSVYIGYEFINTDFFEGDEITIGDSLVFNNNRFRVIGISDTTGSQSDDSTIWISKRDYERAYNTKVDGFSQVYVQIRNIDLMESTVNSLKEDIRRHRGLPRNQYNFEIQTPDQLVEGFFNIFSVVQLIVLGISAISIIVGGIGIMNTMYTAILERTRDIGIMKSIGARNEQIFFMFLIEGGFLGFFGGILGATFGKIVVYFISIIANSSLGENIISFSFEYNLFILVIFFSFLVGALAGFAPSYQASKKKPVDALRYE